MQFYSKTIVFDCSLCNSNYMFIFTVTCLIQRRTVAFQLIPVCSILLKSHSFVYSHVFPIFLIASPFLNNSILFYSVKVHLYYTF